MDKAIYKSKTLWGFGIAGLIAVGQIYGVSVSDGQIASLVQVLSTLFGIFGVRDAL